VTTYEAHTKSEEGVSSIIQLNTLSYYLWGGGNYDMNKNFLIATASHGSNEFRIWILNIDDKLTLTPHFRIETSLNEGIRYLLQSSSNQIVVVDNFKTLKFYEFIDKE
jgi:EF hand